MLTLKQPLLCWLLAKKTTHYNHNPVESNSCLVKSTLSVFCSKQLIFSAGETKACQLIASNA